MENANRRNLTLVYVKADNEAQLEAKLFELSLETLKTPDVLSIYPRGSSVYAWVRVESKHVQVTSTPVKKKAKKKTKKKVIN